MTENEITISAFCDNFDPPLVYVKTQRVGGVPIPDAWMASFWIEAMGLGITAIAHSGMIYSYIESNGKAAQATMHGEVIAKVFGMFKKELTDGSAS